MDGLFWPEPQFIAVARPREPWVMTLRQRVEEALEGAIVPLKVLILFGGLTAFDYCYCYCYCNCYC